MANRPLHVLMLPKWYPHPADPQNGSFIAYFAQRMAARHRISVIFPYPVQQEAPIETATDGNLTTVRVPYLQSRTPLVPLRKLIHFQRYQKALERGKAALDLDNHPPDLIHAQVLIRPALFAQRWARRWGIPWMLTEHSSEFIRAGALSAAKKKIIARLCRGAAATTCVSKPLADGLQAVTGRGDIQIVPNLMALDQLSPAPKRAGKLRGAVIADLVDDVKNISGVLEAIAAVRQEAPPFAFEIIGNGPDLDLLKDLARSLQLEDTVAFKGRLTHNAVLDYLPSIDFLVTNSRSETFSIITAESIGCGRPVIVTRCGGPEHWFREGYGLLIDREAPEQLQKALLKMLNTCRDYDPVVLATAVQRQFDTASVLDTYEQIYREILST